MARLELSMPEELGAGGELGHPATERGREVDIDPRADGTCEPVPIIGEWVETWATGESAGSV
jgi:hypothetical protein